MPEEKNDDLTVRGYQFEDATFRAYPVDTVSSWKDEDRSFDSVLATERPVVVMDMKARRIVREVLRMDGYVPPPGNKLPLQDSHNRGSVRSTLGSTRNIHVEGTELVGRSSISSVETNVATKVKEGHLTDKSLGYLVLDREMLEPGEEREVLGVNYRAEGNLPLQVSTKWTPKEDSLTPIGADEAAKVRSSIWSLEGIMEDKNKKPEVAAPAAITGTETVAAPAVVVVPEVKPEPARRDVLAEITPRGWDALLDAAVIDELDVEAYRAILKAELAKRQKPVGTPEPVVPEVKKDLKVSDEELKRAF